jgi:hypothetical protein
MMAAGLRRSRRMLSLGIVPSATALPEGAIRTIGGCSG